MDSKREGTKPRGHSEADSRILDQSSMTRQLANVNLSLAAPIVFVQTHRGRNGSKLAGWI
jgi:hypothetical protein